MPTPTPASCDVAIIGAGISGLTAAALLTKAGLAVDVFEAGGRPGGYMAGFERQGFIFDTAIHWLNQLGPHGLVRKVFEHLSTDVPQPKSLTRIRRYKSASVDYLLTNRPGELFDQLAADFPEDRRGLERMFLVAQRFGERFARIGDRMRATQTMRWWEKFRYYLMMGWWGLPFLRYLGASAEKGISHFLTNQNLKQVFCSETSLMSILVPISWAYAGDYYAAPAGGSQVYPRWLCRVIEEGGSRVHLRAPVTQVLLTGKTATGVRLRDGNDVKARYVIGACDVETLYERLLPRGVVPERLLAKLRSAELYGSSVTLSIGLRIDPRQLGIGEEVTHLTREGLGREDHSSGDPNLASISIVAPSVRDASLAPPGKGTLIIHTEADIRYADAWHTERGFHRGAAYRAFKEAYARTVLGRVEAALAPGLREHIEVLDIATPVTFWRYTGNRDGSMMGARATRKNMRSGIGHYQTPVKRLLLAGHWAECGGGVPMAVRAACNSSLMILKREVPSAFAQLSAVMDGKSPRQ